MASIQSKLFAFMLRMMNSKASIEKQFNKGNFGVRDCPEPPQALLNKHRITRKQSKGRNYYEVAPKQSEIKILYLHGGAYVHNITKNHWAFIDKAVEKTAATFIVPDYPLALKNTFEDSYQMVVPIYEELAQNIDPDHFILMGDSAGGGFALALAQFMTGKKIKGPGKIILLSPWLDVSMTNPGIADADKRDPFLGVKGLKMAANAYAGTSDLHNYMLSPINGSLEGLGKISLFIGTYDVFIADARKFRSMTEQSGININYFEYPEMVHVWMLLSMPEAKRAQQQIINLILQ